MPVIDDRGRLFGLVNLIDAVVGALVLGLIPLAYGALMLFRTPTPVITSIDPVQLVEHEPATVRITGRDLRPYLRAWLGGNEIGFLVASPAAAELRILDPKAGTFDLMLADEGQELLRKPAAITVTTRPAPPASNAVATVRVRFMALPEVPELLKAGDLDIGVFSPADPLVPESGRASLIAVETAPERTRMVAQLDATLGRRFQIDQAAVAFIATLKVPLVPSPTGWRYRARAVKTGAPFNFESKTVVMDGWILSVKTTPANAEAVTR